MIHREPHSDSLSLRPTADGLFLVRDPSGHECRLSWLMLGKLLYDLRTRDAAKRLHREAAIPYELAANDAAAESAGGDNP